MNFRKIVLLGLILFRYTLSEDCTKTEANESIIVKMSDSITFHFEIFEQRHRHVDGWLSELLSGIALFNFKVERVHVRNETTEICNFDAKIYYDKSTCDVQHGDCSSPQYGNRTTIVVTADYSHDYHTELDFTILKAESTDTGTYMITEYRKSKCYDVCVLGENFTGPPEIAVIPPIIETGASGRFRCISTSTNQTSWLLNYTAVEKQIGRFEIDDKDLLIHYVSRADKNLLVSCRAVEDCGLTTMANMTVPVGYTSTAGTSSSITPVTMPGEFPPSSSQNYVPVIVVGGVLGVALLAASVFIVVLVRRIGCGAMSTCSKAAPRSENRAAEVELKSTSAANYEELNQRNNATPTYDELNLGVGTTGCESVSMATGTRTGTDVYEDTRKTEK